MQSESDYESVVQQRDALEKKLADVVAENTAMKENIENVLSHWAAAEPGDMSWMMDKCMPSLRDSYIESPATDEFTREWMAKGVESGAEHFRSRARRADGLGHHDRACFLDTTAEMFDEYAESLRKGISDAQ
ncbi:hypothetical protein SJZ84_13125 [Hafnia paralvei]|uniref:hypothetical protein n=1 Tax=Hafnia paralvei TaxID=546367 RepID=UPI0029D444E9|nr:hypothetical protein [Hafnia paralvei]MDX6911768.1 hypothetical protein [Hafnia paralvei]